MLFVCLLYALIIAERKAGDAIGNQKHAGKFERTWSCSQGERSWNCQPWKCGESSALYKYLTLQLSRSDCWFSPLAAIYLLKNHLQEFGVRSR